MTAHVLLRFQVTPKIVSWSVVCPSVWEEFAVWRTPASDLQGWQLVWFRWGFRVVTPWYGCSLGVWL